MMNLLVSAVANDSIPISEDGRHEVHNSGVHGEDPLGTVGECDLLQVLYLNR